MPHSHAFFWCCCYMLCDLIGSFVFLRFIPRLPNVATMFMDVPHLFENFPSYIVICAIIFSRTVRLCWSSLSRDAFLVTKLRSMNTSSPCQTGNKEYCLMKVSPLHSRFSVVTQRSWGGALRDDARNGCVADYMYMKVTGEKYFNFL